MKISDKYFVICTSGDGDIRVYEYTEIELLRRLKEFDGHLPHIITNLQKDYDPMYWGNSMLIIKGEIKVPKPEKIVKKWDI